MIVRDGVISICYPAEYILGKQEVTIKLLKTIIACHKLTRPQSNHRDQEQHLIRFNERSPPLTKATRSWQGAAQWQGMCLLHHGALCASLTPLKEATKKQENYKNCIKTIERATKKKKCLNDQTISVLLKKYL